MENKMLEDVQLELETQQVEDGIARYKKAVAKAHDKHSEASLKPQRKLLHTAIYHLSKGLKDYREKLKVQGGFKPIAMEYIEGIDTDVIAFIVSTEIFNQILHEPTKQKMSASISSAIQDYRIMKDFKERHTGLYKYALDKVNSSNTKHKRNAMRHYANYGGSNVDKMSHVMKVGTWFLNKFNECLPQWITYQKRNKSRKSKRVTQHVIATDFILNKITEQHKENAYLSPKMMPMVVKPYPWTNGFDGGYITSLYPLIKYKTKDYMLDLDKRYNMKRVYEAVNIIQDTAWQINKDVLNIVNIFVNKEIESNLIKGIYKGQLPEYPCEQTDEAINRYKAEHPEEWQRWKMARAEHFDKVKTSGSHNSTLTRQLELAEKFKDFDELYFPHNCDFRGRIYPLVPILNPQADDLGKALLHFSYGVPIGKHGDRWLKIHMANSYGNDKISLDDRVKWTEDNEVAIMMIAKDPMSMRSAWETADAPWQYLAACFEYARYKASGEGENFISTLAVGLDGSCNGIQHLASIVKDEVAGEQVNLIPSDKPSDVYQEVADVVERNIANMKDTYANMWKGKVSRKIVKQPVMTVAYGSTHQGRQDQVRDVLRKASENGTPIFKFPNTMQRKDRLNLEWNLVMFITTQISKAIEEVLVGPTKTMAWFKDLVREYNKQNQHVNWVTPIGFPVMSNYTQYKTKALDTPFNNIRIQTSYTVPTTKIRKDKALQSFSANLVHSYDSSHLMFCVNRLTNLGVKDFSVVHDSFATHVGHVQDLSEQLRLTYIEMYRGNVAESIWQELQENLKAPLPKPDQPGHLDITRIMESDYFFN